MVISYDTAGGRLHASSAQRGRAAPEWEQMGLATAAGSGEGVVGGEGGPWAPCPIAIPNICWGRLAGRGNDLLFGPFHFQ